MENKMIKPKKNNFFTNFIFSIYSFFNKKAKENSENTDQSLSNIAEDKKNADKENYLKEKHRIMQMYRDLKKGNINIYDIPSKDLNMLKEIISKEVELKEEKLDQIQTDINMSKNNIKYYEKKINDFKKIDTDSNK